MNSIFGGGGLSFLFRKDPILGSRCQKLFVFKPRGFCFFFFMSTFKIIWLFG